MTSGFETQSQNSPVSNKVWARKEGIMKDMLDLESLEELHRTVNISMEF